MLDHVLSHAAIGARSGTCVRQRYGDHSEPRSLTGLTGVRTFCVHRAQAFKLSQAVVADAKARSNYAVVKTKAVTSHGWEYMIVRMERACLGVYHAAAYVGAAFQEAFPRGRSAVSSDCPDCSPDGGWLARSTPAHGSRGSLCFCCSFFCHGARSTVAWLMQGMHGCIDAATLLRATR